MPSSRFTRALLLAVALASSASLAQAASTDPVKIHGVTYAPTVQ